MSLALTDDHRALAAVVASFATDQKVHTQARVALEAAEPALPEFWPQLAELGWLGLHVPEADGGSGFGLPELAVVLDELGYALTSGPVLPTVTAAAVLGAHHEHRALVRELVTGRTPAALGLAPGLTHNDGRIDGVVSAVLGGRWGGVLVLQVEDDLVVVRADDPAVRVVATNGLDPSVGLATVAVSGLEPSAGTVLPGAAAGAVALLRTLAAAEAAGGARRCLDAAVDYAKVREQFGRPIGSFQAVKHHLANMLVGVELATALVWDAARSAHDPDQFRLTAAAASEGALETYLACARKSIQIFGGIGFTWEHDAHLFLRRATTLATVVGAAGSAVDDVQAARAAGIRRESTLDLPPEAETYRAEARAFLAEYTAAAPDERRELLVRTGYLMPHWPQPFGRAAGAVEQLVIDAELRDIERPSLGIGGWVLLTLIQTASAEQIERWVPPSLAGELNWCQLFSEPNAGSDAAGVQTRGERVDGGWRVTGQKVWTSGAQNCNRGLATVRTDPSAPKHRGVSTMVIDLTDPGVEVRPLREITGQALFNEVFFDGVFVPDADVVGEVNEGWRVARATLGNERVSIGGGASPGGITAEDLDAIADRYGRTDVESRRAIARLVIEETAMRVLNLRQATRAVLGAGPGPEGNVTKLLSAEHAQRVSELALQLAGTAAVMGDAEAIGHQYLLDRCLTIAGGTSEITRNVIAERILGLPRDPLVR